MEEEDEAVEEEEGEDEVRKVLAISKEHNTLQPKLHT